jgi:hypothetical protein
MDRLQRYLLFPLISFIYCPFFAVIAFISGPFPSLSLLAVIVDIIICVVACCFCC